MALYVDFAYYSEDYAGRVIPEESFENYAVSASKYIDYITMYKVQSGSVIDAVKDAVCAVAEVYFTEGQKPDREIKSENTDGYSVSYVVEGKDGQSRDVAARKKAYRAAYPYLAFTGLLNRRVTNDYQCGHNHL